VSGAEPDTGRSPLGREALSGPVLAPLAHGNARDRLQGRAAPDGKGRALRYGSSSALLEGSSSTQPESCGVSVAQNRRPSGPK